MKRAAICSLMFLSLASSAIFAADAPCTLNTLQTAYVAKFGLPPDGTTFTINACVGGYAGTNLDNPSIGTVFVVYQAQGSSWVALNEGTAGVCNGLGIPPTVAEQIGCV